MAAVDGDLHARGNGAGRAPAGRLDVRNPETGREYKLCKECGQPMLPKGAVKKPNEYDHAQGCPNDPKRRQGAGKERA